MAGYKRERPAGSGRWELIVNCPRDPVTGKRRQKSRIFRGGDRAAGKALAALVTEVQEGRHGDSDLTLGAAIRAWLDVVGSELSPSTRGEYRRLASQRVKPWVGKMALRKITPAELTKFYMALGRHGLKPQTIRNVDTVVRGGLGYAVLAGWIASNPAQGSRKPEGPSLRRPPPTKVEVGLLIAGAEEPLTSGRYAGKGNLDLAAIVRLGIACGGRRGELAGLRRHRLDLESSRIFVKRAVVEDREAKKLVEKGTKTHSEREVQIGARAVAALRDHLERMDKRAADAGVQIRRDAFVFSDAMDCSVPWRPNRITQAFGRLSSRVLDRPPEQRVRFHDLRHARATWMLDEGVPLPVVSEQLGHSSMETTARIYVHGTKNHDDKAASVGDEVQ